MLEALIGRPTIALGLRCDGTCIFCAQAGLDPASATAAGVRSSLERLRATADEVTFVGGEPLLAEALPTHVTTARALGFTRVGVQTNGVLLATSLPRLADAGLTDVHLSIHGASPAVHDYHTGRPGSLAAALSSLTAARARGLDCVVATVVTRSNFRVVGELPTLLAARGASAWCASFPIARGRAEPAFDRIMPRLALAMPFVLHALTTAQTLGLPTFVEGAPLCLLGPYSSLSLTFAARAYAEGCATCGVRGRCPGVDEAYLARFDGDELDRTRAQSPPSSRSLSSPSFASLARMFVGIGERAPSHVQRRRIALPVVGKVQPGRGEVSRGVPRKTGEALRDLFPALLAPTTAHEWPVDVVLCGSGRRARRLAAATRETPGLVVIAVASPHAPERPPFDLEGVVPQRSLAAAITHRRPRAVVVAAATAAHAALVREAIAAGLPVLVEKPVGATPAETAALADDARARGVLVMPAWQLVFLAGLDTLRAQNATELAFELSVRADSDDAPRARADVAEPLHHALGVLVWLAAGRSLQVAEVTSSGETVPTRVTVRFASADLAATVRLDFAAPDERVVVRAGDTSVERSVDGVTAVRSGESVPVASEGSDVARLLAHFRDIVRGDATPRVTLDDAALAETLVAEIIGSLSVSPRETSE